MSKTVYLAGPITGKSYEEATRWRTELEVGLAPGIRAASPLRGKEYLAGETDLAHTYPVPLSTESAIVGRDFFDVSKCDLVCMNLLDAEVISIGSVVEVGWADALRTPVLLMMEDGNPHDHPFIRRAAAWRVTCIQDALTVINSTLAPYATWIPRALVGGSDR